MTFAAAWVVAAVALSCVDERGRPAPPALTLELDRATASAAGDTVAGTARADDPDGLDSLWLAFDGLSDGRDGQLRTRYEVRFRLPLRPGHPPGTLLELAFRARDLAGFSDTARDTVTVVR